MRELEYADGPEDEHREAEDVMGGAKCIEAHGGVICAALFPMEEKVRLNPLHPLASLLLSPLRALLARASRSPTRPPQLLWGFELADGYGRRRIMGSAPALPTRMALANRSRARRSSACE